MYVRERLRLNIICTLQQLREQTRNMLQAPADRSPTMPTAGSGLPRHSTSSYPREDGWLAAPATRRRGRGGRTGRWSWRGATRRRRRRGSRGRSAGARAPRRRALTPPGRWRTPAAPPPPPTAPSPSSLLPPSLVSVLANCR